MPAAIEMGPHPAGAAFYCPCGKIYPKHRALVSHQARNPICSAAFRARINSIDAELRKLTCWRYETSGKTRDYDIDELRRREQEATARAIAARSRPKKRGAARKAASDMEVAA